MLLPMVNELARRTLTMGVDADTDGVFYYHADDVQRAFACERGALNCSPSSHVGWNEDETIRTGVVGPPQLRDFINTTMYRTARDAWYFRTVGKRISRNVDRARVEYNNVTRNFRMRN